MANRYWVGGTGTWNTTSTTNWSTTPGGTSGATVPTAADSVFFDQAGTYTVTMTGALLCLDITVSAGTVTFATGTTPTLAVSGSMSLITGTVWSSTGTTTFNSATTDRTITTNGTVLSGAITFSNAAGGWSLGSALRSSTTTTLTSGSLSLNGFDLTTGIFATAGALARSVNFGTNNIILNAASGTVLSMAVLGGFSWSGTGGFTADCSVVRTYSVANTSGGTYLSAPNLTFTGSGTAIPVLTTGSWFNTLNFGTTAFTLAATSLNIKSLTLSSTGTYTNLSLNMMDIGTITPNGKTIAAFTVNHASTTTFAGALGCTTYTQTAGIVNFATFNLTCSGAMTYAGATLSGSLLSNIGTITCTTLTINSGTITLTSGTITPTTSFVVAGTGTFNYNGGTLSTVATFTQTAGTVSFGKAYALSATGTYTLTAGSLTLNGFDLTTGIFSSTGTGVRSIEFGSGNIVLAHTTAAQTVLSMANVTNFTYTGTGGFTAAASVTRTFTFGTTAGSTTNSPNLTLTGSGTAIATITTASWFNKIDFGTTAYTIAATNLNLNSLTLSTGGTFTNLTASMRGTGTITGNGKSIGPLVINNGAGTTTLAGALGCTTYTQTAGTIDFATFNLTCSSTATYTAGTLTNMSTITCTTWTCAGTFTMLAGTTITPSTSFVVTGGFNYSVGTLSPVPTFTQTSGNVTFGKAYSLTSTGTYTLTAGTLDLGGLTLTTGAFASNNANVRSIVWGTTGLILLNHATAGQTVLGMANITNLTNTGTINFSTDMAVTRTVAYGTTGGSSINSANLVVTGTGASVLSITGASWFNLLDLGTTTGTVSGGGNYNNLKLSTPNYSAFSPTMVGTGTLTTNNPTSAINVSSVLNLTINAPGGTVTMAGYLVTSFSSSYLGTLTLTAGTLNLSGNNVKFWKFSSNNTNSRSIQFGSNYILLDYNTSGAVTAIDMPNLTNFTCTGVGGFRTLNNRGLTFNCGNTGGGSIANAPNLYGAQSSGSQTFTAGSWFNIIDYTGAAGSNTVTGSANCATLRLGSGGATFAGFVPTMVGTGTIASSGKTLPSLTINGSGITTTLTSALTLSGALTLTQGTLDVDTFTATIASFSSAGPTTRAINGSGTIVVTGNWTVTDGTGFTGTTYKINMTSASTKTFTGGGGAFGTLNQGGAGILIIAGSNTFQNISASTQPATITVTAGTTQTLNFLTLEGTSGNLITFNSSVVGTQFTLSKSSGVVITNYLSLIDSNATGGASFYAQNSTNAGNNTGWTFGLAPVVVTPAGGQFMAFF